MVVFPTWMRQYCQRTVTYSVTGGSDWSWVAFEVDGALRAGYEEGRRTCCFLQSEACPDPSPGLSRITCIVNNSGQNVEKLPETCGALLRYFPCLLKRWWEKYWTNGPRPPYCPDTYIALVDVSFLRQAIFHVWNRDCSGKMKSEKFLVRILEAMKVAPVLLDCS